MYSYLDLKFLSGDVSHDPDDSPKSSGMGGPEYKGLGYFTGLFLVMVCVCVCVCVHACVQV